ncbi:hypothetical protein FB451DRAFT_107141 [Mycena latifolia]|nr:hypothetical protein FB451DRAFT_107141 [Mycena latifolia]
MPASHCFACGAPVPEGVRDSNIDVAITLGTLARHQELMSTNTISEVPELTFIRTVVSTSDAQLAHLEKEISRLQDRLQQLRNEQGLLSRYRAQNTAILSPLRRMPPEVLAEIFSWTLPSIEDASRKFHESHSPWVLTHVSSRWRAIALSTPSLWSRICINYIEDELNPLSMIKTQIKRAHKLRIHFYGNEKKPSRPQIGMFRLLTEHSAQWEELVIELTADIVPLLANLRYRVPSLHKLRIQWDVSGSQEGVESIDCFQTAPSLFDVTIFNEFHHISTLLPAQQLTRYALDAPWNVHTGILKQACSLIEARIDISFDDNPWPVSGEPIDLSLLRRLYISHADVLRYLRVPLVQDLAYVLDGDEGPEVLLRHLEPFVVRSGCRLRRLCLHGTPVPSIAVEILRELPSLSELGVMAYQPNHGSSVNIFISNLIIPNPTGSAVLAPQLSKIYFACSGESSIDYTLYLRMLQSRWKAKDCALEDAALLTDDSVPIGPVTLRGLNALCQDGLNLLLLDGPEAEEVMNYWFICR